MSEARKILETRAAQAVMAGRLFLEAITGDAPAVGKKLVVTAAREHGREDVASVIDAEFEDAPKGDHKT